MSSLTYNQIQLKYLVESHQPIYLTKMRNTSLVLTPIFVEKRKKQRNVAKVHHLSSTTRTHTKRKKEKGILEKSIAQPNPKLNLSKCVASWTQNNYIITRAFFHQVVVTLKFTPIKNFLLHLFHVVHNHLKTIQVKH